MIREVSLDYYITAALQGLQTTSRTVNGVIDVSASPTKINTIETDLDPDIITQRATGNFTRVIKRLYNQKDDRFKDPKSLRLFIEGTALEINLGITKAGVLIRDGSDSTKYPYTRISDLPRAMEQFYHEFSDRLHAPIQDPRGLAAWVEYRINLTDHFFADGCGKTSKAVSAWVLMKEGSPLPAFISGADLYRHAPTQIRGLDQKVDQEQYKRWVEYYKSLFPND